jgi:hypothetical protein
MRSPFLFLLLLTGCPGTSKDSGDTDSGTDSGDTDSGSTHADGCITIDGAGGYGIINEAIADAEPGSVIELCDGDYEEAIILDKAVTIHGASADGVTLTGPGTDVPLTITATGAVVENLVITAARTGIDITDAEVSLADITVASAGSWGVSTRDSTVDIERLALIEPAGGGVTVSGGTLSMDASTIDYPGGFGVVVEDDAVVTLTDNVITGTLMLTDDVTDGFAVDVEGGTLAMSGNTIAGADGMGVVANDSDVTMSGDTIDSVVYLGIFAQTSTLELDQVSVTGTYLQGIYAQGPTFSATLSNVSTEVGTSCEMTYDDWNANGNGPWCGAMLVAADTIDLTDVTVSGYSNYGLLLEPSEADAAVVNVTRGSVNDTGRWGAYFVATTGTVTDFAVTNTFEPELADPCGGYIDQSVGLLTNSSDLAFDGVTVQDNAGWGMSAVLATSAITGSTFDGNGCAGLINYQSSATIDGSTFSHGTQYGGAYEYQGAMVLTNNTFTANKSGYSYEYTSGTDTYRYEYDGGYGQDLLSFESGALVVTGNTFDGGDDSLYVSGSSGVEISGNTWTDYDGSILYMYQGDLDDPPVFSDNTVDDVVGPVVSAIYGGVNVEGLTVGTTRTATVHYASYTNDVLDYEYTYDTASTVFSASGYYYDDGDTVTDYPAALSLRDVTVASSYSTLLSAYDAALEVDGLEAGDVGGNALYGSWSGYGPDVDVEGLSVGSVASNGIYLNGASVDDHGSARFSDVTMESTAGTAIYAVGLGELSLTDVVLGTVTGMGVQVVSLTNHYDSSVGAYQTVDGATAVTIDSLDIDSTSDDAVSLQGGSADLSFVSVPVVGGDGLSAEGLSRLAVTTAYFGAPGGYGVDSTDSYSFYGYSGETTSVDADTVATLTDVQVATPTSAAFTFTGGSVTLADVSGTGSQSSGLVLSDVTADVQANAFTGNLGYGMTCSTVTLAACATNDLSGNTLGMQLGCDDACGE